MDFTNIRSADGPVVRFRGRRKERTETDAVGSGIGCRRSRLIETVGGSTHQHVFSNDGAQFVHTRVVLPDMDTICTNPGGDPGMIVDEKRYLALATNREEHRSPIFNLVHRVSLCAQLDHVNPAFDHFSCDTDQSGRRDVAEIDDAVKFGSGKHGTRHGRDSTGYGDRVNRVWWKTV